MVSPLFFQPEISNLVNKNKKILERERSLYLALTHHIHFISIQSCFFSVLIKLLNWDVQRSSINIHMLH